jgi:hypothetical protein
MMLYLTEEAKQALRRTQIKVETYTSEDLTEAGIRDEVAKGWFPIPETFRVTADSAGTCKYHIMFLMES